MRPLLLALVLPAGLWAQAMPLPPSQAPTGAGAAVKKNEAPGAARTAPKEPASPALHPVQLPALHVTQLPNGLKLYLVEDHELPVVQGYISVRAGSAFDPAGRSGLSRLTHNLLRDAATPGKRAGDWSDEIDQLGARVDPVASDTTCGFSLYAPRESAEDLLKALAAMLSEPVFRLEKLEVAKAVERAALLRGEENTDAAAQRRLEAALFGLDSPYGRQETDAGIAQLQLSDVKRFHSRFYVPANTAVAIQGDLDPATMRAAVEKTFGAWKAEGTPAELPKPAAAQPAAYTFPAKSLLRARMAVGQLGGELRSRDSAAWEVLAAVLGGTRHSRLMEHARSPVPGDSVEVGAEWIYRLDHPGILKISAACAEPGFTDLLQSILTEVKRLSSSPVTEEELRAAKEMILAKVATGSDDKSKRLGIALSSELAGYPAGFLAQHMAAVAAVTRADVDRLAKTLDPRRFTIVGIGDAEDLARQLKAMGRTAAIVEAPPRKEKTEPTAPDAAAMERGRQLMARAQEAAGGVDQVKAIKDSTRTAVFEFGALAGGGRQVRTERWLAPAHFREETQAPHYIIYTNGTGGFVTDGIRSNPLSGNLYEQVHTELFRWYPRLLLGDAVPGRTMFAVDGDAVEFREGNRTARLVFDDTGLPSEILYEMVASNGQPIAAEEILEDFRVVNGVKMPFRVRTLYNGQPAALVTVQEVKVNSGLTVEEITKRQ